MHARLDHWKDQLLDLTYRNGLLNFKAPKAGGRRSVELEPTPLAALLAALQAGKALTLHSAREFPHGTLSPDAALEQRRAYADHDAPDLERRLVQLARDARLNREELGVSTLFLAVGSLLFPESVGSQVLRQAPLLLVPVELQRKSSGARFQLVLSDEELVVNVTLLEKLRRDFGVQLPELLAELPENEHGVDVQRVLAQFSAQLAALPGARVEPTLFLGHFSFTKFMMWRDLDAHTEQLLGSPLLRRLAASGAPAATSALSAGISQEQPAALPSADQLDAQFPPLALSCVYDADSSQLAAMAAASAGTSFVLEGPPGTGKSQTITNLIAHFLGAGKSVLFVAEKRAALDVVQRRLADVGLGPFCLELHSHKAGKAQVIKQLTESFELAGAGDQPATGDTLTPELSRLRTELNSYVQQLHEQRAGGFTTFEVLGLRASVVDAPPLDHQLPPGLSRAGLTSVLGQVRGFREQAEALRADATAGDLRSHPLYGSNLHAWDPALHERTRESCLQLLHSLSQAQDPARYLSTPLGCGVPKNLQQLAALVETSEQLVRCPNLGPALLCDEGAAARIDSGEQLVALCRGARDDEAYLGARFALDKLFLMDLGDARARLERWATAFFLFAWIALWSLRRALRGALRTTPHAASTTPTLPDNRQLLADMQRAERLHGALHRLAGFAAQAARFLGGSPTDWHYFPEQFDSARQLAQDLKQNLRRLGVVQLTPQTGLVLALASPEWAQQREWLKTEAGKLRAQVDRISQLTASLSQQLGFSVQVFGDPAGLDQLERIQTLTSRWQHLRGPTLRAVAQLNTSRTELASVGLADLATRALQLNPETGLPVLAWDALESAVERAFYDAWLAGDAFSRQLLSSFRGREQDARVARFAAVDQQFIAATRRRLRGTIAARQPATAGSAQSEGGLLRREMRKQRGYLAIRELFLRAPHALRRLKPCVLMSPLSVARYLDIHAEPYDLVVFDEASQVTTHDAVGALARAKQAVVVGDSKQMPPTNFFAKRQQETSDDDLPDDLESILDECAAVGLPALRLRWHYRSRDESLISFSNQRYYDGALFTFPSPFSERHTLGVSFQHVAGVYDRGGSRTNRLEAEALVAELVARLRSAEDKSFGVVTFNQPQQLLIEDLLEAAQREHPEIERYFSEDALEPVFIKNLENVQGDERDVILFSICYGPDPDGKFVHNFGPLNQEGGQRRLNVAVTRAREQLRVFASVHAAQIDSARATAKGASDLKLFLDYAERGQLVMSDSAPSSQRASGLSPLEQHVAERLRALGHTVHAQVGIAGYRVDLGVVDPRDPGRYLLGIECDGAMYRRAGVARDRDRIRGMVLGRLGWRLARVWSADWWLDQAREVERLKRLLDDALAKPPDSPAPASPAPDAAPRSQAPPTLINEPSSPASAAAGATQLLPAPAGYPQRPSQGATSVAYQRAQLTPREVGADAFYAQDAALLADITQIIHTESPITIELLTRRLLEAWPQARITKRVSQRVNDLVDRVIQASPMDAEGNVLYRHGDPLHQLTRYRPLLDGDTRELSDVPILELAAAGLAVLQRDISLPRAELARQIGLEMGLGRSSKQAAELGERAIDVLLSRGKATAQAGHIVLE